ncbi:MAG: TlpA family protein disulfide reductase [Clostridia bacterium]|nr:TlpA family protein disulfide reductase [Clostridia bacterium]
MKRKDIAVLLIGLALILLLGGAAVLYRELGDAYASDAGLVTLAPSTTAAPPETAAPADTTETAAPEVYPAPDFTVYDGEGNAVHLSDFLGQPVVLNFWASWCPPCKAEMPDFDAAFAEHGGEIAFMMINMTDGMQETKETATAHVQEAGYRFPVYFDTDYSAAIAYSASSLPTTYFIRADGTIAAYAVGMLDAASLAQGIDMIDNTNH